MLCRLLLPLPDFLHFMNQTGKQYIKDSKRIDRRKLSISFNIPLTEEPGIVPLHYTPESPDFLFAEYAPANDSVTLWLKDSLMIKSDTISLAVTYFNPFKGLEKTDTLRFSFAEETKSKGKKNKKPQKERNVLKIPDSGVIINLNENLGIESTFPAKQTDTSKIRLTETKDSVTVMKHYEFFQDSICPRKYYLKYPWEEDLKYQLTILPGAFTDFYNIGNDTIVRKYTSQKEEFYGKIFIIFTNVKMNMIVQLLEKDKVIVQQYFDSDGKVTFSYLLPKTYQVKIIYDQNSNGIWDTGDLLKKIQPEKVMYYFDEIKVRSNWDNEINWKIE